MGLKTTMKKLLDQTPLYGPIQSWVEKKRQKKELAQWEHEGRPVPPPHLIKQQNLLYYAHKYNLKILVETGTYLGEMVEAMSPHFDRVYSIELSEYLHAKARRRFNKKTHVELLRGDSGRELKTVMAAVTHPTLFWLDGHYSAGATAKGDKDTPIYEELEHIFQAPDMGHVILIDDARCFGTDPAYPSLEELKRFIAARRENVSILVKDDSIIVTPNASRLQ